MGRNREVEARGKEWEFGLLLGQGDPVGGIGGQGLEGEVGVKHRLSGP